MNRTIIFSSDTKSVNEGEYVTLNWECDFCPDSISLDIDNGHTFHTIQLSDKGTTKLHVSASKGRTRYTLKVKSGGKTAKKVIKIKVRNQKKTKSESKAGVGRFRLWCERQQASWSVWWAQMKCGWASLKKWKKILYIALLALWLGLIIWSIARPSGKPVSTGTETTALVMNQR